MKLTELAALDLIGGTLIEFERGYGFSRVFSRGVVTRVGFSPDQANYFMIETDDNDKCHMGLNTSYYADHDVQVVNGVYRWESPMRWCYAVAPKGVEIKEAPSGVLDWYPK